VDYELHRSDRRDFQFPVGLVQMLFDRSDGSGGAAVSAETYRAYNPDKRTEELPSHHISISFDWTPERRVGCGYNQDPRWSNI
jgi:hypothetical protein